MHVCVYVCLFVYRVCMCMDVLLCISLHVQMCLYVYFIMLNWVNVCVCVYECISACICACVCTCLCTCTFMHVSACMCAHTCVYMYPWCNTLTCGGGQALPGNVLQACYQMGKLSPEAGLVFPGEEQMSLTLLLSPVGNLGPA